MKFEITHTTTKNWRSKITRPRVYVSSNLDELVDGWFTENRIFELQFKCKTWDSIVRRANRIINAAVIANIEEADSCSYSRKAGCSCGCSPGYIITGNNFDFTDISCQIEFTDEEMQPVVDFIKGAPELLKKEMLEQLAASAVN